MPNLVPCSLVQEPYQSIFASLDSSVLVRANYLLLVGQESSST